MRVAGVAGTVFFDGAVHLSDPGMALCQVIASIASYIEGCRRRILPVCVSTGEAQEAAITESVSPPSVSKHCF